MRLVLVIIALTMYSSCPYPYRDTVVNASIEYSCAIDPETLCSIIHAECANCTDTEKYLVGSVVLNRIACPVWPGTIDSVLQQYKQFHGRHSPMFYEDCSCMDVVNNMLEGLYITPDIYYFCIKDGCLFPMDTITITAGYHCFGK